MRRKVWWSPCPGVGFPAVEFRRWWGWAYLVRDLDNKCRWYRSLFRMTSYPRGWSPGQCS